MSQGLSGAFLAGGIDSSMLSAFGVLETGERTPVLQGDFVHGLNVQVWSTPSTSGTGASVDTNAGRLRIQAGTGGTSYAYITNKFPLRYRAGQGMVALFTPVFDTGVASNVQAWGVGGIASNALYDGYFFAFNGVDFGIYHYNKGTPTWIPQTDWNGDKCLANDGSFEYDPTFGSPAMIKYPYLGYGDIFFWLQNPNTGAWKKVHTIQYANTTNATQLGNPTMQFIGFTANSGNTTNKTMYCGSVGVFISGKRSFVGNPRWEWSHDKSSISTETNIIAIRNATTYNGVTNRGLIRLTDITFSSSAASGIARMKFYIASPTLGGSPSYTPKNGSTADNGVTITSGNSIASIDVAGTTVTGGLSVFALTVDNPNTVIKELIDRDLYICPGETGVFAVYSSINTQAGISVCWSEDI